MQMSPARTRTGNADMQSAAFQTDGEITRNNTNQNFNQRDRNSRSDRDQTADERQAHPDRGYEPNVSEHKKTPSAWKESDRKSTRLNSSHSQISYAVFC